MSEHDPSLVTAIATAARNAFTEWRKTHQDEHVFAFALTTIDDARYVSASVNTEESFRRALEKSGIQPDSPDALYYKWGPWEWEHEFIESSQFEGLDRQINAMYDEMHENKFQAFRQSVLEAMIQALIDLRGEGVFRETPGTTPIVLFATIYDSSDAEPLQLISAQAANPEGCISEFLSSFQE